MVVVFSSCFVPIIENGEKLYLRAYFFFHAKSSTTNNHWNGSSDISRSNPFNRFNRNVNGFLKNFQKLVQCRETPVSVEKHRDFQSKVERLKRPRFKISKGFKTVVQKN